MLPGASLPSSAEQPGGSTKAELLGARLAREEADRGAHRPAQPSQSGIRSDGCPRNGRPFSALVVRRRQRRLGSRWVLSCAGVHFGREGGREFRCSQIRGDRRTDVACPTLAPSRGSQTSHLPASAAAAAAAAQASQAAAPAKGTRKQQQQPGAAAGGAPAPPSKRAARAKPSAPGAGRGDWPWPPGPESAFKTRNA